MRPIITVTNVDRHQNITDEWHVRIGNKWKTFNQESWQASGIEWINTQLTGAVQERTARPAPKKARRSSPGPKPSALAASRTSSPDSVSSPL